MAKICDLLLFNTESRKKERLVPLQDDVIRLYTCGPTVYDFAHIGNFRTFVFEDVLKRVLRLFAFKVIHVMNLTDIDDKTIRGSQKSKISLPEYTERYKKAFFEDCKSLSLDPADFYPEATKFIPEMIVAIEKLLKGGFAYKGADGSIYFSIKSFPRYGRLSHLNTKELKVGASVNLDEYSKDALADFVLWKAYDPERDGAVFWESSFGKGRPGWHIECSVMAQKLLGDEIDIHAGGVDLIFPHHENEIAQSEAILTAEGKEKTFVRTWVHAEHLLVNHQKMSKSLGNFYTLRDLLQKGFDGRTIRFLLIQPHYRLQYNFTLDGLDAAKETLKRLDEFTLRLREYRAPRTGISEKEKIDEAKNGFIKSLADDLNVAEALSFLFELIRHINGAIDRNSLSEEDHKAVMDLLRQFDSVLGVMRFDAEEIPASIQKLSQERMAAKKAKDFTLADSLRKEIEVEGYQIEDTPSGCRIKKTR